MTDCTMDAEYMRAWGAARLALDRQGAARRSGDEVAAARAAGEFWGHTWRMREMRYEARPAHDPPRH